MAICDESTPVSTGGELLCMLEKDHEDLHHDTVDGVLWRKDSTHYE